MTARADAQSYSSERREGSFIDNATHAKGTNKTKTVGSRLGSLY